MKTVEMCCNTSQRIFIKLLDKEKFKMISEKREVKLDEVLEELQYLREENHDLKVENDFLRRMKRGLMLNNQALTEERNNLCDELNRIKALGMFEFADKYCNDNELEEAGHAFAKALGVGK